MMRRKRGNEKEESPRLRRAPRFIIVVFPVLLVREALVRRTMNFDAMNDTSAREPRYMVYRIALGICLSTGLVMGQAKRRGMIYLW